MKTLARLVPLALFVGVAAACTAPTSDTSEEPNVASTSAAITGCQSFDAAHLGIFADSIGGWQIADKSATGSFWRYAGAQAVAQRFLDVAHAFGFGQFCAVDDSFARSSELMTYMLTPAGTAPTTAATLAGEACTAFDPNALAVVWASDVNTHALSAGSVRLATGQAGDLTNMMTTIQSHHFVSRCSVGTTYHFEYWKVAAPPPPVYVSTPQGSILIPVGPAPTTAPSTCSASVGCHDAATASCQHGPSGAAYYMKRGGVAYAKEVSPGARTFAWTEWNTGIAHDTVQVCAATTGGETCSPTMTVTFPHHACPSFLDAGSGGGGNY